MIKKEITGIYNVTFNDKKATPVQTQFQTDIELIENAVIESVVMYVKGFHDKRTDKGIGAEHIKLHLEEDSIGRITIEELLNLGRSIREYTTIFKELFIDEKGGKIYEWENKDKTRFRVVIANTKERKQMGGPLLSLPPFTDYIITFYSDRNLNKPMQFKNPEVLKHYENKQQNLQQNKPTQTQPNSKIQTPKPLKVYKCKRR